MEEQMKKIIERQLANKELIRRDFSTKVITNKYEDNELPEDEIIMIASTGEESRYGDYIEQSGWKLERYKTNPIILLNHNYNGLPMGKALKVWVENNLLYIHIKFSKRAEAQEVLREYKDGFMFAGSVGFMVLDWKFDEERGGFIYLETELLEFSLVTVPADASALVVSKSIEESNITLLYNKIEELIKRTEHLIENKEDRAIDLVFGENEASESTDVVEENVDNLPDKQKNEEVLNFVRNLIKNEEEN